MDGKGLREKAYRLGFEYEREYGGCSQCVFAAVMDTLGLRSDESFKAATGLAGGLARSGLSACGALAGGVMAIGVLHGRERGEFKDLGRKRDKAFLLAKLLLDRFLEEYGSCICRDVQEKIFGRSFNLWDPLEVEEFTKAGAHKDKCTEVVGLTASWTVEILANEEMA